MIDAIIFDFDGVILESASIKTDAFAEVVSCYPKDVAAMFVDYHMNNMGISRNVKFRYFIEKILGEEYSVQKEEELVKKFSNIVYEKVLNCKFVPGAEEFLEKYHKKIDLYIATGTPTDEIVEIVKKRNLKKFFKKVYGTPSSKAELTSKIITENGYDKKKIIFVGDAGTDLNASKQNDITFVGRSTKENLNIFKNVKIKVNDLFELDNLIERDMI